MSNRIHWYYDGTQVMRFDRTLNIVTSTLTHLERWKIDADISSGESVPTTSGLFLFHFPNEIQLEKAYIQLSQNETVTWKISNDSTDGFDGSWTQVATGAITSYTKTTITFDPVASTRWLKSTIASDEVSAYFFHLFGEYQSPLFEFWDAAESAELTDNYPFSLNDAPNDANYSDYATFKIKNLDSVTHKYTLTLKPTKYIDLKYYSVDDPVIADDFFLSQDGGVTKVSSLTTADVTTTDFSEELRVYGDVIKSNNPGDGRHYFWVDATQVIPITDDVFGVGTQQDIKAGGDGVKLYGWNVLNSANADAIDVNVTNAGKLTINLNTNTSTSAIPALSFTAPWVFQEIQGDFDVETYVSSYAGDTNYNSIGLCVRAVGLDTTYGSISQNHSKIEVAYYSSWTRNVTSSVYNGGNRDESATPHPYMRIQRVGYDFFFYSKAAPGDTWIALRDPVNTARYYWRRPDWPALLYVGIITNCQNNAGNLVAQIDYFRTTV